MAPPKAAPPAPRRRLDSVKARMALLLAVVLLVPAAYAASEAVQAYRKANARAVASLQRTARLIASYQAGQLERSRLLLTGLAQDPVIAEVREPECGRLLAEQLTRSEAYINLVVTGSDGVVRCASRPELLGLGYSDRSWFQDLEVGASFVVSRVLVGRDPLAGRTIVVAAPLRAERGGTGTISAAVRLADFSAVPASLDLPTGNVAILLDAGGEVVAADRPASLAFLPAEAVPEILRHPGQPTLIEAPSGTRRRFVAEPVLDGRLFVVVGQSAPRWSWLERELLSGVLAPMLMVMLAVVVIWLATDRLINRHVRALATAARAYSQGRLDVTPDVSRAPAELRELGETMTVMARRLEQREAELEDSLEQKSAMLKEIHHRVKNNLQIVTSLLNLRAGSLTSPEARAAIHDAQTRIKALAVVHRNLYQGQDVATIELAGFLDELGELMREGRPEPGHPRIDLAVRASAVQVPVDKAIPIALLVTEAVSNACRHAFVGRSEGRVEVRVEPAGDRYRLVVADDGIGMASGSGASTRSFGGRPATSEPASAASAQTAGGGSASGRASASGTATGGGIGMVLLEMLAKQIGGTLQVESGAGTRVIVDLPSGFGMPAPEVAAPRSERPRATAA